MFSREVSIDTSELRKYLVKVEIIDKDNPRIGAVRKMLVDKTEAIGSGREDVKERIGVLWESTLLDVLEQVIPEKR